MRSGVNGRIRSTIGRARTKHEEAMLDSCEIRRPDTPGAFNSTTGKYATSDGELVYEGACRFKVQTVAATTQDRDDSAFYADRYVLKVPYDAGDIHSGDLVTITKWTDGETVDHDLRVAVRTPDTWRVKREIPLEEVTASA